MTGKGGHRNRRRWETRLNLLSRQKELFFLCLDCDRLWCLLVSRNTVLQAWQGWFSVQVLFKGWNLRCLLLATFYPSSPSTHAFSFPSSRVGYRFLPSYPLPGAFSCPFRAHTLDFLFRIRAIFVLKTELTHFSVLVSISSLPPPLDLIGSGFCETQHSSEMTKNVRTRATFHLQGAMATAHDYHTAKWILPYNKKDRRSLLSVIGAGEVER